jgi:hypothetical protein
MMPAFQPLTHLRRLGAWRAARRLPATGLRPIPIWALGEVTLSAAEAAWLQRAQLCCFGLPARAAASSGASVGLGEAMAPLVQQGLVLRACRLDDVRALQRGDVVWIEGLPAAPDGARLALVVDAGADWVRLSPALADGLLSRRHAELRGLVGGWMLRAESGAPAQGGDSDWDSAWSVAS